MHKCRVNVLSHLPAKPIAYPGKEKLLVDYQTSLQHQTALSQFEMYYEGGWGRLHDLWLGFVTM